MMIAAVEEQREHLERLCRRHHGRRLEVFGSAADGIFECRRHCTEIAQRFNAGDWTVEMLFPFPPLNPATVSPGSMEGRKNEDAGRRSLGDESPGYSRTPLRGLARRLRSGF